MVSKRICLYECRCSQEIHDALQMAMTGHARLLDNYAELQEKHIIQLGKMREIREGVLDIKQVAKRSGLNNVEERWFDVQATQIMYMKVEQDRHREEIQGLQAQLQDTADAVQAAGELLVRLKEAEQAAIIAKVIRHCALVLILLKEHNTSVWSISHFHLVCTPCFTFFFYIVLL